MTPKSRTMNDNMTDAPTLAREFKTAMQGDLADVLTPRGRRPNRSLGFSLFMWGNDDAWGRDKYRLMIEHTIAVARQLGLKTVAEGVETRTEYDTLAILGCDRVQGYLVSRPMDGSTFLRWMTDRRSKQGPAQFQRSEAKLFGT